MPIATLGVILTVTPQDTIQMLRAKEDYEYIRDETPFKVRVTDIMREEGAIIGVSGPVISGPSRFSGMVATVLTCLESSRWEEDMHTQANFKVGATPAHRMAGYPHTHPWGTDIDSYPHYMRFGAIDAEA